MPYPTVNELFQKIDSQCNGFAKLLLVIGLYVCLIVFFNSGGHFFNRHLLGIYPDLPLDYTYITVSPTAEMEVVLKRYGLWDIDTYAEIEPVVFNRYPARSFKKETVVKKKIFFHVLLPAALIAQQEVKNERQFILKSIDRIGKKVELLAFDADKTIWQEKLTRSSVHKLISLAEKYQESNAASLLVKVDTVPVSLVLAQSAIESAWGGSRFAIDGNNMFGIWTWGKNGMVPKQRASGKSHRVAVFVSILDSVRAYTLILNKVSAYKQFRKIRSTSRDSMELAEGLLNYSSRRSLYVDDVKNMIKLNKLKRFDTNSLSLKQKARGQI